MPRSHRLHFTIGPVQSFVAHSRRTRDLWASSFLLSHLAGTAIKAACDAAIDKDGRLILPDAGTVQQQDNESYGTIPNRFVMDFADATIAKTAAETGAQALRDRWKHVADAVWNQFVGHASHEGHGTRQIWERQVKSFWEISWVVGVVRETANGPVDDSAQMLAARKNWRTTPATVEPGDHCTMMSDRQELSGWIRSREKEKQVKFWEAMRGRLDKLDLGEDERLCALALIKRLFPKLNRDDQRHLFPHRTEALNQTNWPSTAYIAAIPWLVDVSESATGQPEAKRYAAKVKSLAEKSLGERFSSIPKLNELKNLKLTSDFLHLDGNFFQKAAIANEKVTPLERLPEGQDDKASRKELQMQLGKLCEIVDSKPSAFYSLLLMDGDSMGALLGAARQFSKNYGESKASGALSKFSRGVPGVVGEHLGVTIYAGGDDVLAMLPVENALRCAMKLADDYREAFKGELNDDIARQATLSGAIVYAHYHTPLRDVLRTAHHLLDDVAKDATGRDSLAIAVYKSSGMTAQWAAPWDHIRAVGANAKADNIIDALIADLGGKQAATDDVAESPSHSDSGHGVTGLRNAEFSSGFLYNVRERFAALTDKPLTKPGEYGKLSEGLVVTRADSKTNGEASDDLLKSVLVADLMRGRKHHDDGSDERHMPPDEKQKLQRSRAEEAVGRLLMLSQRVTRQKVEGHEPPKFEPRPELDTLGIDGALVVRFLACDGKEDSE